MQQIFTNYTQYDVLTYKMAIALRPQICDVTSPYVYGVMAEKRSVHTVRTNQVATVRWFHTSTAASSLSLSRSPS